MVTRKNLNKFNSNKPLEECSVWCPNKYLIYYRKFEEPKIFDLYSIYKKGKIDLTTIDQIVFGVEAQPDDFEKYDFLNCPEGSAFVVHKRVLDKFNDLCSEDIQALPIVIKNLDPKGVQFENKSYYLINIVNTIDMLDKTETIFVDEDGKELIFPKNIHFKTIDYMQSHLLVRDYFTGAILFHPLLAKYFVKSKGIQFLSDEELSDKPYRNQLWGYIHRFYSNFLIEKGIYGEFCKRDAFKKVKEIIKDFDDQIFINYCPNCGNLKKTPQARQCLKCGQFHDPTMS